VPVRGAGADGEGATVKILSLDEFRRWVRNTTGYFRDGVPQIITREFAQSLRAFDPVLADLYERIADTHDEIRTHLLKREGRGS
jgi:hypothetical protein